ncbi:MAG TPA: nuclear transport factor 2 family protein [Pyrinomonadaceae bacterium]
MTTEHEELVRKIYDAYARRDVAAALSRFSPEVEFVQTDLLPWGGRYQGIEGVQASLGKLLAHIDSLVEVEEMISAGDHVVAIARTRGTARASGASFDIRAVHVWTVADGSILRFEAYIDTPAMLSALKGS